MPPVLQGLEAVSLSGGRKTKKAGTSPCRTKPGSSPHPPPEWMGAKVFLRALPPPSMPPPALRPRPALPVLSRCRTSSDPSAPSAPATSPAPSRCRASTPLCSPSRCRAFNTPPALPRRAAFPQAIPPSPLASHPPSPPPSLPRSPMRNASRPRQSRGRLAFRQALWPLPPRPAGKA